MLRDSPDFATLPTPAFVYDEAAIRRKLDLLAGVRELSGARILYSIKALPFAGVLELARPWVDGFSASSLFEARLAREVMDCGVNPAASLHITTPGLRAEEMAELAGLCSHISYNSLEQFRRLQPMVEGQVSAGIRVNPGLSFVDDRRYDPCRPHSKLGVPVESLAEALTKEPGLARRIEGLHFHSLFEAQGAGPLRATLERIEAVLDPWLGKMRWLNLGGGHGADSAGEAQELAAAIGKVKSRHGVDICIEPGNGIVGRAGYLVASVIDRFERDGRAIAVLDTGVQHLPEVFEYQKPPLLAEHRPDGAHEVLLAGCTCLAGDLFGEYRVEAPLELGDKLVFRHVGAYSVIKASRFNGYDLPAIHALGADGRIRLRKSYGYEDYRRQWTADAPSLAGDGGQF